MEANEDWTLTSYQHFSCVLSLSTWKGKHHLCWLCKTQSHTEVSSAHDSNSGLETEAPSTLGQLLQMRKILLFIPPHLNQKGFPSQNSRIGFPMMQVQCFSFLVSLRPGQNLKDQLAELGWGIASPSALSFSSSFSPSLPCCFPWESFLTCSVSAKQGKPRQRKPIKIWARGQHNFSAKGQRVNTFRHWEP